MKDALAFITDALQFAASKPWGKETNPKSYLDAVIEKAVTGRDVLAAQLNKMSISEFEAIMWGPSGKPQYYDAMENRRKLVQLRPQDVIAVLDAAFSSTRLLALPVIGGLPNGYRVLSVKANWETNTIKAMIWHPSFEEVPLGHIPPMFKEELMELRMLPLQRATDIALPKKLLVDIRNAIVMYPHDNELILTIDGMLSEDSPAFIVPENITT